MIIKKVTTYQKAVRYYDTNLKQGLIDNKQRKVVYYLFGIPVFKCTYFREYEGLEVIEEKDER